ILQDSYALAFANRAGVFHIWQKFVQANRNENVIILDGDRSNLPEARMMKATDLEKGIVIHVHPIPDQVDLRSGCVSLETERVHDDKRLIYRFKTDPRTWDGNYFTMVEVSEYA